MTHKYPKDLVFEILTLWRIGGSGVETDGKSYKKLPDFDVLEELVSTCYQVSQLQEEARGLRFRIMLCEPEDIDLGGQGESKGLFTLVFSAARPYNEYELLKLGPSTDYNNSLIGIRYRRSEGLQIWGLIHSGSKWMHVIHGGSKQATPLPSALGVNVVGSGRLIVCRGLDILAQLSGGKIISPSTNVFQSQWVAERFGRVRDKLALQHEQNQRMGQKDWARIDPTFVPHLYLQFFKHVISTMRRSGHGGAIISFPARMEELAARENPYIDLKYRFADDGARNQLRKIVLQIMEVLARNCGRIYGPDYQAGWKDYVSLQTEELAQLDERLFKFARFIARLTGVDGAVVTTEGLELIGFGGIIQGTMEVGESVALALDPEALRRRVELVESVGTRHRSLYYLCHKLQDVLGIIVSQDAKARVVTWSRDMVTCWDVIPIDFA
ncbi:putative sensor domain DACNV-containing protein [Desulfocastanea catecholica]